MRKINLYFNTIKKLSIQQIYYRLLFYFKRKFIYIYALFFNFSFHLYLNKIKSKELESVNNYTYVNKKRYTNMKDSDILQYKFTFLNKTLYFKDSINWNINESETGTRLWAFHLHYLEYLVDLSKSYYDDLDKDKISFIKSTIRDWSISNPLNNAKNDYAAWSRYSVSTRIISLIRINYFLYKADNKDIEFLKFLNSLIAKHALFIKNNLELDILGNHIIRNYKALIFSSIFLKDRKLRLLADQVFNKHIKNQFDIKSGMHSELSPMYASVVAEDLMDIYLLTNMSRLKNIITKLLNCLNHLSVNDQYFFFNDSVNNFAPKNSYLQNYNKFLGLSSKEEIYHSDISGIILYPTGGHQARDKNNNVIFAVNCSNPDMQDGHYHCSNLSFELFFNNEKIFTNSGVYGYSNNYLRNEFRSTSYHNTLQYKDLEQSEIWSLFRVARRAKSSYRYKEKNNGFKIYSSVEGFNFNHIIKHNREINFQDNCLSIIDSVYDNKVQVFGDSRVFFHLSNDLDISVLNDKAVLISCLGKDICQFQSNIPIKIEETLLSKEFGLLDKKKTIVLEDKNYDSNFESKIVFFK